MKQYCRYCAKCVLVDEDLCWCAHKNKIFEGINARRVNKCKNFVFNSLDVFDLERKYKPRENKSKVADGQLSMFEE